MAASISAWHPSCYGDLLREIVRRDLKLRYAGHTGKSILGFFLSLVEPLLQILILGLVFTYIFRSRGQVLPSIAVGILHWRFFVQALTRACTSLTSNLVLLQSVKFPRIVLPLAATVTCALEQGLTMLVFLLIFPWLTGKLWWGLLLYPAILLLQWTFVTGAGLVLAVAQVFWQDVVRVLPVVLNLLFWATPIVYTVERLPAPMAGWVTLLNPMAGVIEMARLLLVETVVPWRLACSGGVTAALLLVAGVVCFTRQANRVVEEL